MKYWNSSPGSHCSPAAKFNQSSGHEMIPFLRVLLENIIIISCVHIHTRKKDGSKADKSHQHHRIHRMTKAAFIRWRQSWPCFWRMS